MGSLLLGYLAIFGLGLGLAGMHAGLHRIEVKLVWYDFWIGGYWNREKQLLYILPLPCVVFVFDFAP